MSYDSVDNTDDEVYYISESEYQDNLRASRKPKYRKSWVEVEVVYEDIGSNRNHHSSHTTYGDRRGRRDSFGYSMPVYEEHYHYHENMGNHSRPHRKSSAFYAEDEARRFSGRSHRYPEDRHSHDHRSPGHYSAPRDERKPAFFCWPCQKSFSSAKEKLLHQKTSNRHFLCQLCDDNVDYARGVDLISHYDAAHPMLFCEFCVTLFSSKSAKCNHMDDWHIFCEPCGTYFADKEACRKHWSRSRVHCKEYCIYCGKIFPGLLEHMREQHPHRYGPSEEHTRRSSGQGYESRRGEYIPRHNPHRSSSTRNTGVHYVTLGVSPSAHQDEILRAAKKRRVETHPDRLKRKSGLMEQQKAKIDQEASKVGHAADILSDPESRFQYDQAVRAGRELWVCQRHGMRIRIRSASNFLGKFLA